MIRIGIDRSSGVVYEGDLYFGRPLWPLPAITSAKFIDPSASEVKAAEDSDVYGYKFREDYYDPVSRIRRGRFYHSDNSSSKQWAIRPNPLNPMTARDLSTSPDERITLETYQERNIWYDHIKDKAELPLVLLGSGQRFTTWKIINVEVIATGEELVTLKARSSLGVLPNLFKDAVPKRYLPKLEEKLSAFTDEVYRASPISVIDRARDAATQIISAYYDLDDKDAQDLGELVNRLRNDKLSIATDSANIIARLHARGKPNEQAKRSLQAIREQDAELVIQCISTLLCELGLAAWR